MKYLVVVLTLIFSMTGSVNANSVNGSLFCELVFRDGGSKDVFITTTDVGMIEKDIEYGDESEYLEIHRGKTNDFKVFVQIENGIQEGIVVLMATEDQRVFHYISTITAQRESVSARVVRGNCKKM